MFINVKLLKLNLRNICYMILLTTNRDELVRRGSDLVTQQRKVQNISVIVKILRSRLPFRRVICQFYTLLIKFNLDRAWTVKRVHKKVAETQFLTKSFVWYAILWVDGYNNMNQIMAIPQRMVKRGIRW